MKRHLTEQELIEYRFKLASDAQMGEIGGHLGECGQCRGELERLARRFAALDLLREEIKASEDLISQVVEQAGKTGLVRPAAYRRLPVWAGAAAAVLIVGLLLMVSNLPKRGGHEELAAKGPGIERR